MNKRASELLEESYYQAINKQNLSENTNLQEQDAVNLQMIHSMTQAAQYGLTDTLNMKNLEIFQGICFAVHQLYRLDKRKNVVRKTVPCSIKLAERYTAYCTERSYFKNRFYHSYNV